MTEPVLLGPARSGQTMRRCRDCCFSSNDAADLMRHYWMTGHRYFLAAVLAPDAALERLDPGVAELVERYHP